MKEKNKIKTKIRVGSVVKVKVGEKEDNKKEERNMIMIKEVTGFVQSLVGKNKFLVQSKAGKKREMSYFLLQCLYLIGGVGLEVDETVYSPPPPKRKR